LKVLLLNWSGIPDVDNSILRDGDEMGEFTFRWSSFINVNSWWDEYNITNKVFVGESNARVRKMFHLNNRCLFLVFTTCCSLEVISISTKVIISGRFLTSCDSVVHGCEIPANNLSIQTTTDENIWIFWMVFNTRDFNWCLKHMTQSDDMAI